jgi:hypothetical protein
MGGATKPRVMIGSGKIASQTVAWDTVQDYYHK